MNRKPYYAATLLVLVFVATVLVMIPSAVDVKNLVSQREADFIKQMKVINDENDRLRNLGIHDGPEMDKLRENRKRVAKAYREFLQSIHPRSSEWNKE